MIGDIDIEELCRGIIGVYECQVIYWDQMCDKSFYEWVWLDCLIDGFFSGVVVLDLGCGVGCLIVEYLVVFGFNVIGVDVCVLMIELVWWNVLVVQFYILDMCSLELEGIFDVIVSWDVFFYFSLEDQQGVFLLLVGLVKCNGCFMMIVGSGEGMVLGMVGGEMVYYGSLDFVDYECCLKDFGFGWVELYLNDVWVKGCFVFFVLEKVQVLYYWSDMFEGFVVLILMVYWFFLLKGFVVVILIIVVFLILFFLSVLGIVVLWWMFFFLVGVVWVFWVVLRWLYKDGEVLEVLMWVGDVLMLIYCFVCGVELVWDCNIYWVCVELYKIEGLVLNYVIFKGNGC